MKSKYMGIEIPELYEIAPSWLEKIHQFIKIADAHDHSDGRGVRLGVDSLNIDEPLSFNNNAAFNVGVITFEDVEEGAPYTMFFRDGDLHIQTTGLPIRLTQGGEFNTSLIGGIGGDYGGDNTIRYSTATQTFYFESEAGLADVEINKIGLTDENPVTVIWLAPDNENTTSYTLTLPNALEDRDGLLIASETGNLNIYLPPEDAPPSLIQTIEDGGFETVEIDWDLIPVSADHIYEPLRYDSTGCITVDSSDPILFAKGNTSERPETAENRFIRYNTSISLLEVYRDGNWEAIPVIGEDGLQLNNLSNVVIPVDAPSGILYYNPATNTWEVEGYQEVDYETRVDLDSVPDNVTDLSLHSILSLSDVYNKYRDINDLDLVEEEFDKQGLILKYFEERGEIPAGFYFSDNLSGQVEWSNITGNVEDQLEVFKPNFDPQEDDVGIFNYRPTKQYTLGTFPQFEYGYPEPWLAKEGSVLTDFKNVHFDNLKEGDTLVSRIFQETVNGGEVNTLGLINEELPEGQKSPLKETGDLLTFNGVKAVRLEASKIPGISFLQADPTTETGLRWYASEEAPPQEYAERTTAVGVNITNESDEVTDLPIPDTQGQLSTDIYEMYIKFKYNMTGRVTVKIQGQEDFILDLNPFYTIVDYSKMDVDGSIYWGVGALSGVLKLPKLQVLENPIVASDSYIEIKGVFKNEELNEKTLVFTKEVINSPLTHIVKFIEEFDINNTEHIYNYDLNTMLSVNMPQGTHSEGRRLLYAFNDILYMQGETGTQGETVHGERRFLSYNIKTEEVLTNNIKQQSWTSGNSIERAAAHSPIYYVTTLGGVKDFWYFMGGYNDSQYIVNGERSLLELEPREIESSSRWLGTDTERAYNRYMFGNPRTSTQLALLDTWGVREEFIYFDSTSFPKMGNTLIVTRTSGIWPNRRVWYHSASTYLIGESRRLPWNNTFVTHYTSSFKRYKFNEDERETNLKILVENTGETPTEKIVHIYTEPSNAFNIQPLIKHQFVLRLEDSTGILVERENWNIFTHRLGICYISVMYNENFKGLAFHLTPLDLFLETSHQVTLKNTQGLYVSLEGMLHPKPKILGIDYKTSDDEDLGISISAPLNAVEVDNFVALDKNIYKNFNISVDGGEVILVEAATITSEEGFGLTTEERVDLILTNLVSSINNALKDAEQFSEVVGEKRWKSGEGSGWMLRIISKNNSFKGGVVITSSTEGDIAGFLKLGVDNGGVEYKRNLFNGTGNISKIYIGYEDENYDLNSPTPTVTVIDFDKVLEDASNDFEGEFNMLIRRAEQFENE